jgi:hypothetical protein
MSKKSRFCRQFRGACARFQLVDPSDCFLVPIDADHPRQLLVFGLIKRCDRPSSSPPAPPPIHAVHFYSTDSPVPATVNYLQTFCRTRRVAFSVQKIDQPRDKADLHRIYYETAIAHNCQKVALPDSEDFIAAAILTKMSLTGVFGGPPICEPIQLGPDQPPVTFIRPFCLLTDGELAKSGTDNRFLNAPTGVNVLEDPFMAVAKSALDCMSFDTNNVRRNIFNAQFKIQKKYVGANGGQSEAD